MEINKINNHVRWKIFIWVIGIIALVFGWVFTSINMTSGKIDRYQENVAEIVNGYNEKLESYQGEVSEIRGDIKEIRVDISWIKKALGGK